LAVPLSLEDLADRLRAAFAGADVRVEDLTGGGDHFAATIISTAFAGKLPIARHRMVYAALGDAMKSDIHALALTTRTPDETV
jgi:stress-induced morphogen